MEPFIGRRDDVGFVIMQDNDRRHIVIEQVQGMPDALNDALGYTAPEMEPISRFLPERIADAIDDYVEYDPMGNDFLNVIKKTPRFSMLSKQGHLVEMSMRIQYGVMSDHPRFIVVASSNARDVNACIAALDDASEHDVLDPTLDLPNQHSFLAKLDIIQNFVNDTSLRASCVVLQCEHYVEVLRSQGEQAAGAYMRTIVQKLQANFRGTDALATLGEGTLAVALLKAGASEVAIPFERLNAKIGGESVDLGQHGSWPIAFRIVAHGMEADETGINTLERCQDELGAVAAGEIQVV